MGKFIMSQLLDLDGDVSWFPRDGGLVYQEEGDGSIAESLSSLSTNGSEADAADIAAMAAFHGVSMSSAAAQSTAASSESSFVVGAVVVVVVVGVHFVVIFVVIIVGGVGVFICLVFSLQFSVL